MISYPYFCFTLYPGYSKEGKEKLVFEIQYAGVEWRNLTPHFTMHNMVFGLNLYTHFLTSNIKAIL